MIGMNLAFISATRREPIPGGSTPASMLATVAKMNTRLMPSGFVRQRRASSDFFIEDSLIPCLVSKFLLAVLSRSYRSKLRNPLSKKYEVPMMSIKVKEW